MILQNAVVYSTSMFEEAMCMLVSRYAGLNVVSRLTETECRSMNSVLKDYLEASMADAECPLPFTLLVGNAQTIGEWVRSFIIDHAILVIDCQAAFPMMNDPEDDAPPICPAIEGGNDLVDDQICPAEYESLFEKDRGEYDPSMIRCYFEDVKEAACPSRPDFEKVRVKRAAVIDSAIERNRAILMKELLYTRDAAVLLKDRIDNEHIYKVYSKMVECLVDGGVPLQFKVVARKLNAAGLKTKADGDKLIQHTDLRQMIERLGKTVEWRELNDTVSRLNEIRNRPDHRLSNLEKLMLAMIRPLRRKPWQFSAAEKLLGPDSS
jgi:hypothetical protein